MRHLTLPPVPRRSNTEMIEPHGVGQSSTYKDRYAHAYTSYSEKLRAFFSMLQRLVSWAAYRRPM